MKFGVVIGNPPYNKGMDLDFIKLGHEISKDNCSMIVPAKWNSTSDNYHGCASKTIDYAGFRSYIVPFMKYICFYPNCKNVFDISQADGITFFLIDKDEHEEKIIENRNNEIDFLNSIEKRSISNRQSLHNLGNEIINSLGNYEKFKFDLLTRKRYEVHMTAMLSGGLHFNAQGKNKITGVCKLVDSKNKENTYLTYCDALMFSSTSYEQCKNFIRWLDSKFVNFFLFSNISNLDFHGSVENFFRFVPAPILNEDGSYNWDIEYNDEILYKHYNLKQEYIDKIEKLHKVRNQTFD